MSSLRTSLACAWLLVAPALLQAQSATGTARVSAATASVRAEAKPDAAILTTLKSGATVEVRGSAGDFYQVTTFVGTVRIQGYVLKRSVTMAPPAPPPAAGTAATASPKPVAMPAATASAKFGMSAVAESGGKSVPLVATMARTVQVAERTDSPRAAAMAMPIGAPAPLPADGASAVSYLWLIDVPKDAKTLAPKQTFTVQFRDIPGISPDDFAPALVSLAVTPSGTRVMSVLRGRRDQATRAAGDWDVARDLHQDVVKAAVELAERGVGKITPAAELPPGEYAVVLRPTGNKKFSGTSVLTPSADGRIFGIAWVFVVK